MKYLLGVALLIIIFAFTWSLCQAGAEADRQLHELWSKKDGKTK